MQPFTTHTGLVAPLDRFNVDTDQMVPKQFLKLLTRQGFGRVLFYDWRYLPGEKPNPDFVLNLPRYRGASILLARANFGCGSSREHAPWALLDYGFRVVIAPSFADIFHNNCLKNGILTITLPEAQIDELFRRAECRSRMQTHRGSAQSNDLRRRRPRVPLRHRPVPQAGPARRTRRHRHDPQARSRKSPPTKRITR